MFRINHKNAHKLRAEAQVYRQRGDNYFESALWDKAIYEYKESILVSQRIAQHDVAEKDIAAIIDCCTQIENACTKMQDNYRTDIEKQSQKANLKSQTLKIVKTALFFSDEDDFIEPLRELLRQSQCLQKQYTELKNQTIKQKEKGVNPDSHLDHIAGLSSSQNKSATAELSNHKIVKLKNKCVRLENEIGCLNLQINVLKAENSALKKARHHREQRHTEGTSNISERNSSFPRPSSNYNVGLYPCSPDIYRNKNDKGEEINSMRHDY